MTPDGVRLQKVLAAAGVGSRRACEDLITAGRVEVDGRVITELGTRIDPDTAAVRVDGRRITTAAGEVSYLAVNKPRGTLTAMSDDRGRPTIADLLRTAAPPARRSGVGERLFHVGRLDADTEGLLLLTNDGDLAHRLMHPSFGVQKTYLATVPGPVRRDVGRRLRAGIELEDGPARADAFRVVQAHEDQAIVELTLHEGRNHIVRRMLAEVGYPVSRLVRTRFGPVRLGALKPGAVRPLSAEEVTALATAVDLAPRSTSQDRSTR